MEIIFNIFFVLLFIIIFASVGIYVWIQKELDYRKSVKLRKEIAEERRKYYESNNIGRGDMGQS